MFTKLWTIKMSDWQRALVIAVLTGPFGILFDTLSTWITSSQWTITFDWHAIVKAAVAGFLAYFGKNFITGQNGRLLTNKEGPPAPPPPA